MKDFTYTGRIAGDRTIVMVLNPETKTGHMLPIAPSQQIRNHSPTGFAWGYGGSGPSQLALALLLHAIGECPIEERPSAETAPALAERFYQMFKADHVSQWDGSWTIKQSQIIGWLRQVMAQAETKRTQYSHSPEFPKDLMPPQGSGTTLIQG